MCGFPVYSNGQRTISLWFYNSVQEGDGAILLVVLYCKPYGRVNTVYVLKEALFVGLLVDDKKQKKEEKELLQARIKSINFILDNTSRQLEECRSKLATIISTQKLRECQDFVDKVSENRFNKVKQRQINKLNLLTIRKEGNITRSNTNPNNYNHNHNSQANRQVISQVPPGEDNRSSQAGPPHREASTSPAPLHANSQAREGGAPPQAGTTPIPPGEDTSLSQVSTPLPSHPTTLLPSPEDRRPPNPSNTQTVQTNNPTIVLGKVAGNPQGKAPRPPRRCILPPGKARTPLPPQLGTPRVLLKKNLTLSGSLTFPTNP